MNTKPGLNVKDVTPLFLILTLFVSGCARVVPEQLPVPVVRETPTVRKVSGGLAGKDLPPFLKRYNSGVNLLDTALRTGKPLNEAEKEFEAALAFRPGFFPALYNIAYIAHLGARYGDALRNIEAALSYRKTKDAELLKASILEKSKEWDSAIRQYLRVAEKYGGNGFVFGQAGAVLMEQRKYREAVKYLEKSGKLTKEMYQIFVNKGTCYLNIASYKKAVEAYGAVYSLGIRERYLLGQYAFSLRKSGDIKMALKVYEELIELFPDEKSAYKNAGIVYDLYLNRPDKAAGYYRRYIEIGGRDRKNVENWRLIAMDKSKR